ncbi:MAG: hypothetical protein D4S02_11970 [Rhodocyclaceae bacterium]|nr:MAG: hypothetical protein D4S02_11970 [Rhodocyclaceae bacterium]
MQPDVPETGNPTIDSEHRVQISLIRALVHAIESGKDIDTSAAILEQLIDYSDAHFMSEELLMRLASYDGYEEHVADHVKLIEALKALSAQYRAGNTDLVAGSAQAAIDFLLRHIETRDRQYSSWIRD